MLLFHWQNSYCFTKTDCPLSELQTPGSSTDDNYHQCQQDQDTVTSIAIPSNRVVNVTCYSGRQFVSVASHVCDEGYQPNATSNVRVCRDNGLWSGTNIVCGEWLTLLDPAMGLFLFWYNYMLMLCLSCVDYI